MLDPSYVNEFTDVRKLHEIETVDTRTVFNEIMPKFYYCIVAAELAGNAYIAPPSVSKANSSLYFTECNVG